MNLLGNKPAGWRAPQLGALGATMAHWSLGEREPTVISIPTGTGKTAVAMASPFLMEEPPTRVLVLAPARAIRQQLVQEFSTYAQLRRIGVLPAKGAAPAVFEMSGKQDDWAELKSYDVVVALPNSISPVHYDDASSPPQDLFDLVLVDEAHHAPAATWRALLDHYEHAHRLLLTATPRRRDGKRIPGSLEYYYPLRRALDEGLYKPITPVLLPVDGPTNRGKTDAAIATRAAELLNAPEHKTSVLLIRGGSIKRLNELKVMYMEVAGVELAPLHTALSPNHQQEVIDSLRGGQLRAVGVVGMLGEGFDLPSLRLVAYHDKHRSVPATIQLIGRLARVDERFPQGSVLIAAADVDVFPELKGVLKQLYDEDSDWAEVLPGILDEEIQQEQLDREFVEELPASHAEVEPGHLEPIKRALVYELPADWNAAFLSSIPDELREGTRFAGGTVAYAGANVRAGLLVIVVRYVDRPKWSSDPALANILYRLHVVAYRRSPRTNQPSLVLLNLESEGLKRQFEDVLGLVPDGRLAGPQRLGAYLDSLDRISVSSVGVRSTNAVTRGRATYRNFMGSGVDRGLRTVDMARSALGHVMLQVTTAHGAANAGGAVEKSKVWLSRYGSLRELSQWADETANLLWFPRDMPQGRLLPGMDRGQQLEKWPSAIPLAADLYPALLGSDLELWKNGTKLGGIEDLDLFVNDDPTNTLHDVGPPGIGRLAIIGVFNDREHDEHKCVWNAAIDTDGRVHADSDLEVRRGYSAPQSLSELFEENPPTIYFLDGSTTIGRVRYDSRASRSGFGARQLDAIDWSGIDITAETRNTAERRTPPATSIHEHLETLLQNRPRIGIKRWIMCNDGSGEIADYIVIEELSTGEIHLGLWHAKAAGGATVGVRVNDFQVVVAQALRSRRWFVSTELWTELRKRLTGESSPRAVLVDGSDEESELKQHLGEAAADDGEHIAWTQRLPVVTGTIGIIQPGLSAQTFEAELESATPSAAAESLRQLFSVLRDMTVSDGSELVIWVSD